MMRNPDKHIFAILLGALPIVSTTTVSASEALGTGTNTRVENIVTVNSDTSRLRYSGWYPDRDELDFLRNWAKMISQNSDNKIVYVRSVGVYKESKILYIRGEGYLLSKIKGKYEIELLDGLTHITQEGVKSFLEGTPLRPKSTSKITLQ